MNKSFDEIVEIMLARLAEARLHDEDNYINFMDRPREMLHVLHHTLGRDIRNEFGLWEEKWEPYLIDGIDRSPNHPDAISMRIMEAVWDKAHGIKEVDNDTQ